VYPVPQAISGDRVSSAHDAINTTATATTTAAAAEQQKQPPLPPV